MIHFHRNKHRDEAPATAETIEHPEQPRKYIPGTGPGEQFEDTSEAARKGHALGTFWI